MDTQDILKQLTASRTPVERIRGVYVLYQEDIPVYVGQAIDVTRRVYFHLADGSKEFDSFAYVRVESGDLNAVEASLIVALNPRHNQSMPSSGQYASLAQLKRLLTLDLWTLKKLVRKYNLQPVWGDVYDIAEMRAALAKEIN